MTTKDLGMVTAYAYAVMGGYEGTEAEFEALLGNIATDLEEIENLTVVANTLPEGSSATASYADGVLTLGIPKGDTGATGAGATATVGTTTTGDPGTNASVTNSGTAKGAVFNFTIPRGATGNGIESIYLTGTSGAVKTYTILFTDGNTTTFDVTDGEVTNASLATILEDYAKTDGAYEQMTVGNAEQLISSVTVNDKVPYNFRTSGGSIDIGNREVDKLVGGTVAWNQIVNSGDTSVTVQSGHKYYSNINNTKTIGSSNGSAISINDSTKDNVTDLTQMFGSAIADYIYSLEQGTAGAGVAWFKKLFPKDYYAYNAGELMSVKTSAHQMVGFNAWDEEWEVGSISPTTGANAVASDRIRTKNYNKCVPSTTYYANYPLAGNDIRIMFYDNDNNFISSTNWMYRGTFTTPDNAYHYKFVLGSSYGATYNHDICINLSWDGERNGDYEAYKKWTYPLDSDLELRGIPKLDASNKLYYDGDTYEDDGTVNRRFGILDLGTKTWTYNGVRFSTLQSDITLANTRLKGMCSKYFTYNGNVSEAPDKALIFGGQGDNTIYIKDSSYTDATAFTTAMNGVYLVYELNTPTTETADPYQNPQIVDDFGTEEYVDERTVAIPVGHDTEYMNNLKAKLEMAPDSPDGDGDYIVRQANGENSYVPLMKELPSLPSTDGTYTLKCTVASGTATLGWEREE